MAEETPSISYEKLKLQGFSKAGGDLNKSAKEAEVLANFGKLDFSATSLGENLSKDDINFNDGKPAANPFNKIGKYYGRHLDVFHFISMLRDEKQNGRIMEIVGEKCDGDEKTLRRFRRKMNIYLERVEKGEIDAAELVKDTEVVAFFNGYHVASEEHPRNIHENLNLSVEREGTILETSSYFQRSTPRIEEETSQLRRQKIFAKGERVATVVKTEDGHRNYMFTKSPAASLELEIGWNAVGNNGNELKCVITLGVKCGRLALQKVDVDTEEDISVFELAKQNKHVLVRGKSLHDFLEKKYLRNQGKKVKVTTKAQNSGHFSSESIIVREVPLPPQEESKDLQEEIFEDISKLDFSVGPLSPNPFDELAKMWGRKKDVFQFNSAIRDEKVVQEILDLVGEKCGGDAAVVDRFKKRMSLYLKRIGQGESDAKLILKDDTVESFSNGYHIATPIQPRNARANLNINLKTKGKILETSQLLTSSNPQNVEEEDGSVKRLKLYGNGKRISTIEKNEKGQRNYSFSSGANMDLEIAWNSEKDMICTLTLGVKRGKLHFKNGSIDGVAVDVVNPKNLLEVAAENKSVLVQHSALRKILGELLSKKMGTSKEKITFEETIRRGTEGPTDFESVLEDFGKLDLDWKETFKKNPDDGKLGNQFAKVRKLYGRHKNIFLFIDVVRNEGEMDKILDIVRRQYADNPEKLHKFVERKDKFLEAIEKGTELAKEFLGDIDGVLGFLSGHELAPDGHGRNVYANLNIKVLQKGTCLDVADLFNRSIKGKEGYLDLLERVKIYDGEGRRIVTVLKEGASNQRKYTFTKDAQLSQEIEWTAQDKDGKEVSCSLTLKMGAGQLKVKDARVDGKTLAEREDILEMAAQNEVVKFKEKSLAEMLKQTWSKKKASTRQDEFVLIDDFGIGDDEDGGSAPGPRPKAEDESAY